MARTRRAPPAPSTAVTATTSERKALTEKTNTAKQRRAAPVYEGDGNTDGLVKTRRGGGARTRKAAQEENDLYMTGGLNVADKHATTTEESAESDDPPRLAPNPVRRNPRMNRKPTKTTVQADVLEGLKKRMNETARREAAKRDAHPENTKPKRSLSPDVPRESQHADLTLSPVPISNDRVQSSQMSVRAPGSVLRVHATPVVDTSTFALRHFKRRPRQGSMLQVVQQKIASARTSAAHMADDSHSSTFDLGVPSDEEDFFPEAEGTPMNGQKVRQSRSATIQQNVPRETSASPDSLRHKRKSNDTFGVSSTAGRLRAKRQRLSDSTHDNDGKLLSHGVQTISRTRPADRIQVRASETPSSPGQYRSLHRQQDSPEQNDTIPSTEPLEDLSKASPPSHADKQPAALDGTMADPASSSPPPGSPEQERVQRQMINPEPITQPPPSAQPKRSKRTATTVSTARLQALLPRRRKRPRPKQTKSLYEIPSDDDDEPDPQVDGDEGGEDMAVPTQHNSKSIKTRRGTKPRIRQSNAPQALQKSGAAPKRTSMALSTKKAPITYGKGSTSDKENEAYETSRDVEESTIFEEPDVYVASKSKELEEAKKKFADIDDWEMEFESMSGDDHRRSSQTWR